MRLQTERLLLREFVEEDHPDTHRYESDPDVVRYTSFDVRTPAESRGYILRGIPDQSAPRRLTWDMAIVLRPRESPVIGRCGLRIADPEQREGVLWWILHRAHWGKGYVPEAMRALLDYGYGPLKLHRVYADCDPRNAPSIRVCEKLGMRREAHLVENLFVKGEWCDSLLFALLDREWKAARR